MSRKWIGCVTRLPISNSELQGEHGGTVTPSLSLLPIEMRMMARLPLLRVVLLRLDLLKLVVNHGQPTAGMWLIPQAMKAVVAEALVMMVGRDTSSNFLGCPVSP
jgi:hypothetical protein